jgi:hypothetical protein
MPLCEWGTSTIQALTDAFSSSPRYVNRNTRRGYVGNPGHWRLATDSDSSPVSGDPQRSALAHAQVNGCPTTSALSHQRGAVRSITLPQPAHEP